MPKHGDLGGTSGERPVHGLDRPELNVREAGAADVDQIWPLEAEVFGAEAWSRDIMLSELTGEYRHYIALVGDKESDKEGDNEAGAERVFGYAGLLAVGTDGDIQTIAVDAALRGHGFGAQLMNELLDEADRRGVQQVFLEVRADNPPARGLYEALGFTEIGVRPRYYQPDDVDAIVMRLQMEDRR